MSIYLVQRRVWLNDAYAEVGDSVEISDEAMISKLLAKGTIVDGGGSDTAPASVKAVVAEPQQTEVNSAPAPLEDSALTSSETPQNDPLTQSVAPVNVSENTPQPPVQTLTPEQAQQDIAQTEIGGVKALDNESDSSRIDIHIS